MLRIIITIGAAIALVTPPPRASALEPAVSLAPISAGQFVMGSPPSETGRNPDEMPHTVTLTRAFLLGRHEVTQQEWRVVMGTSPSFFTACGPRCPVEHVSYGDVESFLVKMNEIAAGLSPGDRLHYRLPTEAEWEYACRAGTTTPFPTGANLTTAQANFNGRFPYGSLPKGRYREQPTPAATFAANAWGLADMNGNVWEWTSDWYGPYEAGTAVDPHGAASGEKRVIRGGSWFFDANSARCALRYTHAPQDRGFSLGFRVAADRVPAR